MISVFLQLLRWSLICSNTSLQMTNWGPKVPWKRTKERRFKDWLTLTGMRMNRRALFGHCSRL